MTESPLIKPPAQCAAHELAEFERLVREGFAGSDETLPARIRRARLLCFGFAPGGGICAIAALKRPAPEHRARTFELAREPRRSGAFELELGWVYVIPRARGAGLATLLCRALLARAADEPLFATTRSDNAPMIQVLGDLGFERAGSPFLRGAEELDLYLRE